MPDPLSPGDQFAGHRIENAIGRGGMGVVYLATHLVLERRVALKVLLPGVASDENFRQRFIRESRAAAGLEHPNVVPIYEAGEFDGALFLSMRYVQSDLKRAIQEKGALPPHLAISLLSGVADALDAAHRRGLIHRDVKPHNVLLELKSEGVDSDRVYLSDFGLTKQRDSGTGLTAQGTLMGTLDYISPEQIEDRNPGPASDQYSFTCMLFECLTGRVPFEASTDPALIHAHMSKPPPDVTAVASGLPAALAAVLTRGMDKDPSARFASCGDLIQNARAAIEGRPVDAGPARRTTHTVGPPPSWQPPSTPFQPPVGRPDAAIPQPTEKPSSRRGLVLAIGIGVLLVGVTVAFLLTRSDPKPQRGPVAEPTETVSEDSEASPDPDDFTSYLTTDGSTPALAQECNGVLGLCLSSPIDKALEMFGTEDTRFEGAKRGATGRQWDIEGVFVTLESDSLDTIQSMTAAIPTEDPTNPSPPDDIRLALPQGLVLGDVTMGQVKEQLGEPDDTNEFAAENVFFYSYIYNSGPEGTETIEFSHNVFGEEIGFGPELDLRKVSSFTVRFASTPTP